MVLALLLAVVILWSISRELPALPPSPLPATSTPTIAVIIVDPPPRTSPPAATQTATAVPTERLPMATVTRAPTETPRATDTPAPTETPVETTPRPMVQRG